MCHAFHGPDAIRFHADLLQHAHGRQIAELREGDNAVDLRTGREEPVEQALRAFGCVALAPGAAAEDETEPYLAGLLKDRESSTANDSLVMKCDKDRKSSAVNGRKASRSVAKIDGVAVIRPAADQTAASRSTSGCASRRPKAGGCG